MPTFKDGGVVWSKPGVGTPVVTCMSCGAIINQIEQAAHEKFHAALAQLFDALVK